MLYRSVPRTSVSELWKEEPPAHFSWKISGFSQLSDLEIDEHYSGFFMVGGYKWRLCLYPKGNEDENGQGHISLYLEMMKPTSLTGWEVYANFKLFIFDQKNGYHRTLEESGQRRLYHAMKHKWGLAQFMSLATFKEPNNGTCVIGAEAVIHREKVVPLSECLQLLHQPEYGESTWRVRNFSDLGGCSYTSPTFSVGGYQWRIILQPKGVYTVKGCLSVFLELCDASSLPLDQKVYTKYILRVVDQKGGNGIDHEALEQFSAESGKWGNDAFVPLQNLRDPAKGFLVDDMCKLIARVAVLGLVME